jgi:hypothetical protein
MHASSSHFPDHPTLTARLTSVLSIKGYTSGQVIILDRQPNIDLSTFPSEIVTCQLDEGSELRLLCKYEAGHSHKVYGHRGNVAYEAEVYRHVLQPLRTSTPTFYGALTDMTKGETLLILEYLDNSLHVHRTPEPVVAMSQAARWIGRFHAENEARLSNALPMFLNTYDAEYYLGWVRRALLFAKPWHTCFPWLASLCERSEEFVAALLAPPPTVIHSEYYPLNILFRNGIVHPVDWESAAIAAGEIDLASLTEGWPAEIARECELEYQLARWPAGAPANFDRTLGAAQLYWSFRWLGDRPDWTTSESNLWRFERLRSVGERLRLI